MKKFILFNSPIFWDATKEKEQYLSPLGLGYIATYLEKAGIDVTIVDCVKERKSVNDIVDFINKTHPNYIGINIFTQNYEMVKYIIESITITCDCFIGGQVVKSIYLDILRYHCFYSRYKRFQSWLPMHQVTNIYVLSFEYTSCIFLYNTSFWKV